MNSPLLLICFLLMFSTLAQAQSGSEVHEHSHDSHDHHEEKHNHGKDEHHDESAHTDDHADHDHDEEHHQEGVTEIKANMADQVGIETAQATSETLNQNVRIYGSFVTGPEQLSHVRARFEGMIESVHVSIGDFVAAGDLLAEVESNDSLKTYQIRAPIPGQVIQRHANTGEVTQDQVLFSIANFESLWAELRVFPAHASIITKGQTVRFMGSGNGIEATINHIVPALDTAYQVARVKVDNSNLTLSPGQMVEAQVKIGSFNIPLAVEIRAIQSLGGREGVFVRNGDEYTFTPLILGRRDSVYAEVMDGLHSDDEYVTENSYLIKADIEKSEAEHVH